MKNIYEVKEKTEQEEEWEQKEDNVLHIQIQDFENEGKPLAKERIRVQLTLSKNAMLGFGTGLIRLAQQDIEKTTHLHLDAATYDRAKQVLAIYLHPDSPELIIGKDEMGTLDEILKIGFDEKP